MDQLTQIEKSKGLNTVRVENYRIGETRLAKTDHATGQLVILKTLFSAAEEAGLAYHIIERLRNAMITGPHMSSKEAEEVILQALDLLSVIAEADLLFAS